MGNKKKLIDHDEKEPEVKPVEKNNPEIEIKEEKPVHCGTVRV